MGFLNDIRTRVYSDITGSAFFVSTGIPVVKFDYDIETQIQSELNKIQLCVQVNFCELMGEPKSFQDVREYVYQGTVDVFEKPEMNRMDGATYYTADTIAESVAAILQRDTRTMDDVQFPLFHILGIRHVPITSSPEVDGRLSLLKWKVTYGVSKELTDASLG